MFNLSNDEINEIIAEVKKFDPKGTGYVGKHEVDDVLRGIVYVIEISNYWIMRR